MPTNIHLDKPFYVIVVTDDGNQSADGNCFAGKVFSDK